MGHRARAFAFRLVAVALVVLGSETAGRVAYRLGFGHGYTPGRLAGLASDASYMPRESENLTFLDNQVLHPYFGFAFVGSPAAPERHGFIHGYPPTEPPPPNTISVLVTGGSVAIQLSLPIQRALRQRLRESEGGRNQPPKRARVFLAALGGFKQPQQLMALNYLLALGSSFDAIVNIDGYNEIALPYAENAPLGVHPAYPRRWDYRFRAVRSSEDLAALGEIAHLNRRKEELARFDRESAWSRSAVAGTLTALRFVRADRRILEIAAEASAPDREPPFEVSGPPFDTSRPQDVFDLSVDVWARSSQLMAELARARGIPYLHVLQPNQHHRGAKPLSREEREEFYRAGSREEEAVSQGYPLMLKRSTELVANGVDFLDATRVFEADSRTVYRDPCCHFNPVGVEILSVYVADALLERLNEAGEQLDYH